MILVALGWMYVVLMMSVAEATAANGTVLGAVITFLLYGVLPLSIVMYLMGTPGRRRRIKAREAASAGASAGVDPDGGGHAAGETIASERKEP